MRLLRAITVGVMLVAWATGAVAACLAPDSQLSEEEKACCREMAPSCGEEMQASHSCCTKSVQQVSSLLASRHDGLNPDLTSARLALEEGSVSPLGATIPIGLLASHSPPGSAPGATTILRI
ncbi:MAG: hypothetical protein ACRD2K_06445 [Terriglobales bacterium]